MENHGCRQGDVLPAERYVWSARLREAYREVLKVAVDPDYDMSQPGRSIWGFGWFRVWVIK